MTKHNEDLSVVGRGSSHVGSLLTGVSAGGSGGEDSLSGVGDLGHVAVGVVSGVGDGLDTAVGKGDGVGASDNTVGIAGLGSVEVGLAVEKRIEERKLLIRKEQVGQAQTTDSTAPGPC